MITIAKRIARQALTAAEELSKKTKLSWNVYMLNARLRYRLRALYEGISINKSQQASLYNFRRNIHRLEKGLSYKKVKPVFAEDYIEETVTLLERGIESEAFDGGTLSWGIAVLNNYFQVASHEGVIQEAYKRFCSLGLVNKKPENIPYTESTRPPLSVTYEDMYQLAVRRRSVRIYQEKKVEYKTVVKAMEIAALSPSACNRQSFKFLFFNEAEIVSKIKNVTFGVVGYELPSIIVIVGCYQGYFEERDLNAPMVDASLAAMSFCFAAETLGLGTVCINWPSMTELDRKIRKIIEIKSDEFVVMFMGVGYPDPKGKIPYSAKKNADRLILNNERAHEIAR